MNNNNNKSKRTCECASHFASLDGQNFRQLLDDLLLYLLYICIYIV